MKKTILATIAAVGTLTAFSLSASPATAAAPVDQYCPDTKICQKLERVDGLMRATMTTTVYYGYHEVCVKAPRQTNFTCTFFEFQNRPGGGGKFSSIGLVNQFDMRATGEYTVAWRVIGWPVGRFLNFRK